jgi:hypothetical protein
MKFIFAHAIEFVKANKFEPVMFEVRSRLDPLMTDGAINLIFRKFRFVVGMSKLSIPPI